MSSQRTVYRFTLEATAAHSGPERYNSYERPTCNEGNNTGRVRRPRRTTPTPTHTHTGLSLSSPGVGEWANTQTPKQVSRRERTRARARITATKPTERESHRALLARDTRTHARAHRKTFPPNRKEERRKPTVFESYSYPVPLPFSTHSRSGFCCPVPGARRNPAHAEPHRTRRPAPNTTTTALQGRPLSDGL